MNSAINPELVAEIKTSIYTRMENETYVSLQQDLLFGILKDITDEIISSKNDYKLQELELIKSKLSSNHAIISYLWEWDEIGYEFLVPDQQHHYHTLIVELFK